jgi:transaldolase
VVKLPCTEAGLTVAHALRSEGGLHATSPITITGVYTAHQALLAQVRSPRTRCPGRGRGLPPAAGGSRGRLAGLPVALGLASLGATEALLPLLLRAPQAVRANYAAPYLGRMNDMHKRASGAAEGGFDEVAAMARTLRATGSSMRLLVASIKDAHDIARLAAQVGGLAAPAAAGRRRPSCAGAARVAPGV